MTNSADGQRGGTNWKIVAGLMGALAALLTAIATLVPEIRSIFISGQSGVHEAAPTARDAERLATQWVAALQGRDLDALVDLAQPPFYMDSEIRVSKAEVRRRYEEMLRQRAPQFVVTRMDARTVGEFRGAGLLDTRDRLISSMRVDDDDFAVVVWVGDEATLLFFRRMGADLEMAGFWG